MLLQAESIQKFVEPCNHVIVVNEDKPDIDFWYRWLKPYYNNHNLSIIPRIPYYFPTSFLGTGFNQSPSGDASSNGWRTQQLQKLLLAYDFEDDYLLLDSKNFFTKKTNINEWDDIIGSGAFLRLGDGNPFSSSCKLYSDLLEKPMDCYLRAQTPFKVARDPFIKKCKRTELAYLLFYPEFKGSPATEGIFYSHFVKDEIDKFISTYKPDDRNYLTVWSHNRSEVARLLFDISLSDKIKIVAFHRELLSNIDDKELEIINFWLGSDNPKFGLGLKNKIYPMPRDSHV